MILVTGGTGFIGQVLVRNLVSLGYPVRLLINPSTKTPNIPRGIPVDVAISSIHDERNLRAALKDVRTVFHLIGTEWQGINADYAAVDIPAAAMVAQVSAQMNIQRLFYLSHIGADRNSAYGVLRSKANAEAAIINSGVPYTILQTAAVYGPGDHFTEMFARYLRAIPFVTPVPGEGEAKIQPIWVDDLVTCLLLCMDNPRTINELLAIGGIETLSIRECFETIARQISIRRRFVGITPVTLRGLTVALEQWFPRFPKMYFWMDYLAEDRITALDVLPRVFSLIPTRMGKNLEYLR